MCAALPEPSDGLALPEGIERSTSSLVARRAARPTAVARGQLALELPGLPSGLPTLGLDREWKAQQRLWGHSFHPMCSYLASFPASLAHAFIARYSRPGDVVLDPFSGRGTVPLQACAEGRVGVGNDLNPFAHLLTAAKVEPPTRAEARTRLTTLRLGWLSTATRWRALADAVVAAPGDPSILVPAAGSGPAERPAPGARDAAPVPAEVAVSFHPATLGQLLYLRAALREDEPTDRFLAGALTGILHGKSASYLSEVMPNTFSMAPRYVRDYTERTAFHSPERDVFESLDLKLRRLFRQAPPHVRGLALLGDARDAGLRVQAALRARALPERARLVVTSPPYLRVVKYGYYNWLRLWFLGYDAAAVDSLLDDAHHRDAYLVFLRDVLRGLRPALADDAVVVLVIGDVEYDRGRRIEGGVGLAEAAWEAAAAPEGYRLAGIAVDDVAPVRKMTKLWGDEAGQATKRDRILVVAPSELGRRRALNGAGVPVDWTWPPRELRAV
ncbi:MAG TPA: DNA methyltransferase [Candidatus Limnocylindrales bacterium]